VGGTGTGCNVGGDKGVMRKERRRQGGGVTENGNDRDDGGDAAAAAASAGCSALLPAAQHYCPLNEVCSATIAAMEPNRLWWVAVTVFLYLCICI